MHLTIQQLSRWLSCANQTSLQLKFRLNDCCGLKTGLHLYQHLLKHTQPIFLWGGGYFASLRARASSREPRAFFCEPRKIPAKKSKNGHNALIWYLYMWARPPVENVRANHEQSDCYQVLFLFRIPKISEESSTAMMNWFFKNETGSKFWLTEIT